MQRSVATFQYENANLDGKKVKRYIKTQVENTGKIFLYNCTMKMTGFKQYVETNWNPAAGAVKNIGPVGALGEMPGGVYGMARSGIAGIQKGRDTWNKMSTGNLFQSPEEALHGAMESQRKVFKLLPEMYGTELYVVQDLIKRLEALKQSLPSPQKPSVAGGIFAMPTAMVKGAYTAVRDALQSSPVTFDLLGGSGKDWASEEIEKEMERFKEALAVMNPQAVPQVMDEFIGQLKNKIQAKSYDPSKIQHKNNMKVTDKYGMKAGMTKQNFGPGMTG